MNAERPINVVITIGLPLPDSTLDELRAIDSRLRVRAVTAEQRPFLQAGKGGSEDPAARALAELLCEAEVFIAAFETPPDLLERAPGLRWFHTIAAGIDQYIRWGYLRPGLLFTNGSGPAAIPIAEHCLMAMLMLAKSASQLVRHQERHAWDRAASGFELRGKTVGIVGLGQIGAETARLAKALGCRVIGIRRSVAAPRENAEGVDLLLPPSALERLLRESDFVVLAAPSTPETRALINAETLALMKPSAVLVNIARGTLVDETALIEALKAGRLAGAALDVFDPEPLRPDSELWDMPNVIVTPHISALSEHFLPRQVDLIKENLRRYLHDEPLLNLVPPERGY